MLDSPDEMDTPPNSEVPNPPVEHDADAPAPEAEVRPSIDDLLPVLPKGDPLFANIPTRAVVLEELAPALGDGALVVSRGDEVGVVLIRERVLFENYCFSNTERLYGKVAMDRMKTWDDATVSAYRLDPEMVDICPSLLRGDSLYSDLRLEWTDWNQLLTELTGRDGNFVVEVRTSKGRGVTCIANGKQIATFTEAHPELGPPSLLDTLAAVRDGSVWVHSEPPSLEELEVVTPPSDTSLDAEDRDFKNPFAAAAGGTGENGAGEDYVDDEYTNPFATVFGPNPSETDSSDKVNPPIQELLPELKAIVHNRLQRSAARVEAMLDDASEADRPLDEVLDEIRGLVIRGIMQSTLDELVDEMQSLASSSTA